MARVHRWLPMSVGIGLALAPWVPAQGEDALVYHTYVVPLPDDVTAVSVTVEGFGHDMDLALNLGSAIVDYTEVFLLDVEGTLAGVAAAQPPDDPFLGDFAGDGLRVTLTQRGDAYAGTLTLDAATYPLEAVHDPVGGGTAIAGTFQVGDATFPFELRIEGEERILSSGEREYRLLPVTTPTNPLDPAPPPLDDGPDAGPAGQDVTVRGPVVARGEHGILYRDDALAKSGPRLNATGRWPPKRLAPSS